MRVFTSIILITFLLSACGGGSNNGTRARITDPTNTTTSNLTAAKADSEFADVLVPCTQVEADSESCPLSTLPLIGQSTSNPDIDTIMNRVVVSDTWMAENFEQLLVRLPQEIRLLLRSVTAVVIARDIRPSFYTTGTGAIYLDPDNLWLTEDQRSVISTEPDFRSSFDDELAFVSLWRYVKDNQYAFFSSSSQTRTIEEIELPMAALLFHELAHAADFFPPALMGDLDSDRSVLVNGAINASRRLSNQLVDTMPLSSDLMYELADVMFRGETASLAQTAIQPLEVAAEFSADLASDDYAYSTQYEDFAMLFEEAMMKYQYDIDRDTGYSNRPPSESPRSAYILAWGMRNRAADADILPRTELVLKNVLDLPNVDLYLDRLGESELLTTGISWDNSIFLFSGLSKAAAEITAQKLDPDIPMDIPERPYRIFDGGSAEH